MKLKKKLAEGILLATFLMLYGVLRFIVEFYRAPDVQVGFVTWGLTMGQILNIGVFISGVALWMWIRNHPLT